MKLFRLCLLALLSIFVATAIALGQDAAKPAESLTGALLIVKADWSQSPAAKEIDAEMRKALEGAQVAKELLDQLPASGPQILFPVGLAGEYSNENYQELLAWLRARGVFQSLQPFDQKKGQTTFGNDRGARERPTLYLGTLIEPYDFLALPPVNETSPPFVVRRPEFQWFLAPAAIGPEQKVRTACVERRLAIIDRERGQEDFRLTRVLEAANFSIEPLADGHVWIANAFPSGLGTELQLREAARRKGIEILVVISRQSVPEGTSSPRLHLPSKVSRVETLQRISYTWSSDNRGGDRASASPAAREWTPTSGVPAPAVPDNFDLELKKWEVEGQLNAAQESLSAIVQQLTTLGVTGQERRQLEAEHARLRQQAKSYSAQLELINERLGAGSRPSTSTSTSTSSDAAADQKPQDPRIKVFSMRNANARQAERIVNQIFGREIQSVAADERTNSLIVRGDESVLNLIDHILVRLDGLDEQSAAEKSPPSASTSTTGAAAIPDAELAKRYQAKEQQAADLARQIRELQAGAKPDKARLEKLSAELRRFVGESFAARQQLHQAELGQLQRRMGDIEQNLKSRQRMSDQIIEHRVKDLLNPDLQWDAASSPWPQTDHTTTTGTTTPSRLGSLPQPKVSYGTQWGEDAEAIWKSLGLTVQPIKREEAPDPKLSGALRITAIAPDSPAKELRVGDLIVTLQVTGGRGNVRRAEIHVRRDKETIRVFAEFPAGFSSSRSETTATAMPNLDGQPALVPPPSGISLAGRPEEVIWKVLGIRVQAVEGESLRKAGFEGGLLLTGSGQGRASGLEGRDVIVGIDKWATTYELPLAWAILQPIGTGLTTRHAVSRLIDEAATIHLIRDGKLLSQRVELAAYWPTTTRGFGAPKATTSAPTAAPADLAAARAYRDKLRERVQLLERGYKAGELPFAEMLSAKAELDEAEIAAAASSAERSAALAQRVETLRALKAAAEKLVKSGERSQTDLLGAEAALLKAEAELAADQSRAAEVDAQDTPAGPAAAAHVGGNQPLVLRSADDFRRVLREAEEGLANGKQAIEEMKKEGAKTDRIAKNEAAQASNERRLEFLREEYAAQLHLLELELQDSQSAVQAAESAIRQTQKLFEAKIVSRSEVQAAELVLETAQRRLQRAQTLLNLYRKADPKNSNSAPAASNPPAAQKT